MQRWNRGESRERLERRELAPELVKVQGFEVELRIETISLVMEYLDDKKGGDRHGTCPSRDIVNTHPFIGLGLFLPPSRDSIRTMPGRTDSACRRVVGIVRTRGLGTLRVWRYPSVCYNIHELHKESVDDLVGLLTRRSGRGASRMGGRGR